MITHIIVFHDGSTKDISRDTANEIIKLSTTTAKGGVFDASYITFGSIAKIITQDEYREQYPDKRPEVRTEFKSDEEVVPFSEEQLKTMRTGLLRGLKQFIDEEHFAGRLAKNAQKIYDDFLTKKITKDKILQSLSRTI